MSLPASFTTVLGDPQITPETGRLVDIPKPLLKHLKPMGHELTLWQAAAQRWLTRLEKGRFEPTLLSFLQHWQPKIMPDQGATEVFNVILRGDDERGWKVIASSLKWVNDPAWSALLHLPALSHYWITEIRGSHLDHLRQIVSQAWFMDPSPLPPGSVIAGLNIPAWPNLHRYHGQGRAWSLHGTRSMLDDSISETLWKSAVEQALQDGSMLLVEEAQGASTLLARYKKGGDGIQLDVVWQA